MVKLKEFQVVLRSRLSETQTIMVKARSPMEAIQRARAMMPAPDMYTYYVEVAGNSKEEGRKV